MLFVVWVYEQVFHCCRRVQKFLFKDEEDDNTIPLAELPWLWLGFVDSEGTTIDYTNTIKLLNVPNIHVTSDFLTSLVDLSAEGKWQYVDSKTLQLEEFPSEGFVINNVVDEPATDKKTD